MPSTPIVLLVGQAGSGKDTVAGFLVEDFGAISIAQADPMKRLVKTLFEYSDEQLWGPSELRNAHDPNVTVLSAWANLVPHGGKQDQVIRWLEELGFSGRPIDDALSGLYGWIHELKYGKFKDLPLTPRLALQTLGTEWGRVQDPAMWSRAALKTAMTILSGGYRYDRSVGVIRDDSMPGPDMVVISDGRFRNEVLEVKKIGGAVVKITNPPRPDLFAGVVSHKSEAEMKTIPDDWYDSIIVNVKEHGLAALRDTVWKFNKEVLKRPPYIYRTR